jgi:hypothetical protein
MNTCAAIFAGAAHQAGDKPAAQAVATVLPGSKSAAAASAGAPQRLSGVDKRARMRAAARMQAAAAAAEASAAHPGQQPADGAVLGPATSNGSLPAGSSRAAASDAGSQPRDGLAEQRGSPSQTAAGSQQSPAQQKSGQQKRRQQDSPQQTRKRLLGFTNRDDPSLHKTEDGRLLSELRCCCLKTRGHWLRCLQCAHRGELLAMCSSAQLEL